MEITEIDVVSSEVFFVSLGCPKNLVDSEVMLGMLQKENYRITQNPSEAEVIIVNTCSFIDLAKEESIDTVLEMAAHKETGKCRILVASGCLAQRYSKELQEKIPEIDLLIGTGQYHRITEALEARKLELGGSLPARAYIDQPAFIHSEKDPRINTGPKHSAFLKVSEGCNRRCAFCIIPKLRGNVRSRKPDSLVAEAEQLASQGVRELNLVAQDLTEYGMEWKYRDRLETLLPRLCRIEGIEWIRLHYVYPDEFSDELIEIIAREPKIVKYLDMPIQHTNDDLLKKMNRRLTKAKLFGLVNRLRDRIPEIVFRTSIIVGFPGETETSFQELCSDLSLLDLDHVGVFTYSKEEGTKAALLGEQVHPSTKRRRKEALSKQLEEKSLKKRQASVGQEFSVLVEGPSTESEHLIQARMPTQAQEIDGCVLINDLGSMSRLRSGDFVKVKITEALPFDLIGKVVENEHTPLDHHAS